AYGTADGMKTAECSVPERQPAGSVGGDGRLWFTSRKGVVAIDPTRTATNEQPPPVVIERVVADGEALRPGEPLRLAAGRDSVEFHYTGLSLLVPERVRFMYRLEGFDAE